MWTATRGTKCCATCANWGGQRKVRGGSTTVETESPATRGKCYAGVHADATDGPAAHLMYCPKYETWAAVR